MEFGDNLVGDKTAESLIQEHQHVRRLHEAPVVPTRPRGKKGASGP